MNINTETITTMTEANQNFSKVAKVAEKNGQAVIFKNNKPKFLLIDVDSNSYFDITETWERDPFIRNVQNYQIHGNIQIYSDGLKCRRFLYVFFVCFK